MPLQQEYVQQAFDLFRSALWADVCRVANENKPRAATIGDTQEVAAAKGHQRAGWEAAIESLQDCYRTAGVPVSQVVAAPLAPSPATSSASPPAVSVIAARLGMTDEEFAKVSDSMTVD